MSKKRKSLQRQSGGSASKIQDMRIDASRGYRGKKRVPKNVSSPYSCDSEKFRWSAKDIDIDYRGDWDWDLKPSELRDFLRAIEEYSTLTWTELISQGNNKHHSQLTETLSKDARSRLWHLFSDADSEYPEEIFRFRIAGTVRLWGFRENGLFKILWFDRDHKVYPVKKRHT